MKDRKNDKKTKFPSAWYDDFYIKRKGLLVKHTDTLIPFKWWVVQDILTAAPFFFFTKYVQLKNVFKVERPLRVYFTPQVPRPWYFIWPVMIFGNVQITRNKDYADAIFYFDDKTYSEVKQLQASPLTKHINPDCIDISKSRVSKAYEVVFNETLAVDPERYHGDIVKKSEKNAAHDGVILQGPFNREEHFSYQKLIDNSEGHHVVDYRCVTIGGEVPVVIIKKRPLKTRFANTNSTVSYVMPKTAFSSIELSQIKEFCLEMNLDWGSLDILRDNKTKQIYIVDVNKTEMGPPIIMKLKDKIAVTKIIGKRFREYLETI